MPPPFWTDADNTAYAPVLVQYYALTANTAHLSTMQNTAARMAYVPAAVDAVNTARAPELLQSTAAYTGHSPSVADLANTARAPPWLKPLSLSPALCYKRLQTP